MTIRKTFQSIIFVLILLHIYWQCYSFLMSLGISNQFINNYLLIINTKYHVFQSPFLYKVGIVALLAITGQTVQLFRVDNAILVVNKRKRNILFFLGIMAFFGNHIFLIWRIPTNIAGISYICILFIGFYILKNLFNQKIF